MRADIALLTDRRYESPQTDPGDEYKANILRDDQLLQDALKRLGLASVRVDWSRADVDWTSFHLAVFRTPWDYFDRFDEFTRWLDRAANETVLCNAAEIVRWNMDKHYLADLEAAGVPVVPSRVLERGDAADLAEVLEETGWREAVLKPCVSGAARHTYRVDARNVAEVGSIARRLLIDESLMLQPFQENICWEGEDSLMVIDGCFTHAVRKVARPGDFRVQDDHGGTVHPWEASDDQVALAQRALAACPGQPAYGRVDMVRDRDGRLAIMEVELIEPELWLRLHPPAADALAEALARRVEELAR
jgi:glutathione synthase/RimK-type ligase-like ATP-grasp enzyme